MRTLAVAITGLELPAVEKISRIARGRSVSGHDRHAAVCPNAGRDDLCGVRASVQEGRHTAGDGEADGKADREADLSRSASIATKPATSRRHARRSSKEFGGRTPATMEELLTLPGVGRKTANLVLILAYRKPAEHLRRYARPSNREPAGLGPDEDTGRNGTGAVSRDGAAMVAVHQSVSRHVGAERVPARLPTMSGRARSRTSARELE